MRPQYQVLIITGAGAAVGRATARLFAEQGARLGLIARGRDGLDAATRKAEFAGSDAATVLGAVGAASARTLRAGRR